MNLNFIKTLCDIILMLPMKKLRSEICQFSSRSNDVSQNTIYIVAVDVTKMNKCGLVLQKFSLKKKMGPGERTQAACLLLCVQGLNDLPSLPALIPFSGS